MLYIVLAVLSLLQPFSYFLADGYWAPHAEEEAG